MVTEIRNNEVKRRKRVPREGNKFHQGRISFHGRGRSVLFRLVVSRRKSKDASSCELVVKIALRAKIFVHCCKIVQYENFNREHHKSPRVNVTRQIVAMIVRVFNLRLNAITTANLTGCNDHHSHG